METTANDLKASFIPESRTGKRGTLKFLRLLLRRYPRLRVVKALEDAIIVSDSGIARSDAQVCGKCCKAWCARGFGRFCWPLSVLMNILCEYTQLRTGVVFEWWSERLGVKCFSGWESVD